MNRLALYLATGISAVALGTAAHAADLIIADPVVGVVDVGGDWEGPYVGVHLGYGFGDADHIPAAPGPFTGNDLDLAGLFAGVQVGYNVYLSEGVVGGFEADLSWADISGTEDFGFGDLSHSINWMGSLRARLGFDGGAFMPYLTAGLAVAGAERVSVAASDTATHFGWTAGAGVDVAVTEDMSLNLEYRYSDFGAQDYETGGPAVASVALTTHTIRAGLNWHF